MKCVLRLTPLLAIGLLASGCAGSTLAVAPTVGCSSLIPNTWRSPVSSAALPPETAVEADWQVFGIQQTARLSEANGRTADVIAVVETCEARDRQAVRRGWFR